MQRTCCTRAEIYGALLHASVFYTQGDTAVGGEHDRCPPLAGAAAARVFFVECEPQKAGRKQQLVLTEPAQIGRVF